MSFKDPKRLRPAMDPSALPSAKRQPAQRWQRISALLVVGALATLFCGCHAAIQTKHPVATPPYLGQQGLPVHIEAHPIHVAGHSGVVAGAPAIAERPCKAQEILATAETQHRAGRECCVDLYYQAAQITLRSLGPDRYCDRNTTEPQTHKAALAGFVLCAQQFGRYSPQGIWVNAADGLRLVPIEYHGFAWHPNDFNELRPAVDYRRHDLRRHFVAPGIGVPLVVVRKNRDESPFFAPDHPFAATAVLQPGSTMAFYNPLVHDRITVGGVNLPLERDATAPIAYVDEQGPRNWLAGFLDPFDPASKPKLTMLEPYQRGKVPVVFIHGLLSEPMAWGDLVNELRVSPEITSRFQFWAYRYPTGGGFLDSAASLRELLQSARDSSDPAHADRSLDQMVLIGHSMGGLMAKTQVTESWDIAWRQFASQPIESIRAPPQEREKLRRLFFFEPSRSITRVVLIGTPHQGSSWSRRVVGRLGTRLVRFNSNEERQYQSLVAANQDIIQPRFQREQPTSIELLDPESPLLAALSQMPVKRDVRIHTIVGARRRTLTGDPTDGVVTVASAQHRGAASELWVDASHSDLHHDATTIAEVRRILLMQAETTASDNCETVVADDVGPRPGSILHP